MNELENVRLLPASQPQKVNGLPLGMAVWRDTHRHALNARLRDAERRGEVELVQRGRTRNQYGQYLLVVKVLKHRRSRAPWYIGAGVAACGVLVGVGAMLWNSRYVFLAVAALCGVLWLLTKVTGGQSGHGTHGFHWTRCK